MIFGRDGLLVLGILAFGFVASIASLAGTIIALVSVVTRSRRSHVNVVFALVASVAAVSLDGFMVLSRHFVRGDMFVVVFSSTPIFWLGAASIALVLRPIEDGITTSKKGERIAFALGVAIIAYFAVTLGVYFALPSSSSG